MSVATVKGSHTRQGSSQQCLCWRPPQCSPLQSLKYYLKDWRVLHWGGRGANNASTIPKPLFLVWELYFHFIIFQIMVWEWFGFAIVIEIITNNGASPSPQRRPLQSFNNGLGMILPFYYFFK